MIGSLPVGDPAIELPQEIAFDAPNPRTVDLSNIPELTDNLIDASLRLKFQTSQGLRVVTNALVPLSSGGMRYAFSFIGRGGVYGAAEVVGSGTLRVHIKNNRAGEFVFRTTPERYADAERRHPDVAPRINTLIDWALDRFEESIRTADVLMTWDFPTDDLARRAPRLKWVHIIGSGVEHLGPLDWLPPGVALTNNSGIHAEKTTDYVMMALGMLNNRVPRFVSDQRERRWDAVYNTPIAGKTVTIVGLGRMGAASARAAKALGLRVIGVRRKARPARNVDAMYDPSRLDDALGQADFVILTLPHTSETHGLIDGARLDAIKPEAGLINIARAPVLDHGALVARLASGHLSGAVLDVHDPEPLPDHSPLWHAPNLVVTPHVSSDDDESYVPLTLDLLFENLQRLLDGKSLRNRVRPKLGY